MAFCPHFDDAIIGMLVADRHSEEAAVMLDQGPLQLHSPCSIAVHHVLFAVKKA